MIGREQEIAMLKECLQSPRPEFMVVYGRRRVGKTFLIKEFFKGEFAFYSTGVAHMNTRGALRLFNQALCDYGASDRTIPVDWFDAFSRLKALLSNEAVRRDFGSGKRVVFLDELPWMETPKSMFKQALDYFWNSWGADQKDLLLIVCGSATSWIISSIFKDTGGFYNRVTRKMHLLPFCLYESEQLLLSNGVHFSLRQVVESYMIFGGIPYYLNYIRPDLSLAQNVEALVFRENGPLHYEYDQMFQSLFKNATHHKEILEVLAKKKSGMTRVELLTHKHIPQGKELTRCLQELEQCGFIRKYVDYTRRKSGHIYQLIDSFTLFNLTWLKDQPSMSWLDVIGQPGYYSWCGVSFERVCLMHMPQIKRALCISGMTTQEYAWVSKKTIPGAQIDMLIDRKDDVINLCEDKFTSDLYFMDAAEERALLHKMDVFRQETGTKKALHLTMITLYGLNHAGNWHSVVHEITGKDLMQP